jgi:predicted HNH restriction endonuclease
MEKLIEERSELLENIRLIEQYLCEGNDTERDFAISLIKKGRCFVAYKVDNKIRFSTSRFIGYLNNNIERHLSEHRDGRDTNPQISRILRQKLSENPLLEEAHSEYCNSFGVEPDNVKKTFWEIELTEEEEFTENKSVDKSFIEGAIVERIHSSRERNAKVIEIAKKNFKAKYGKLFCEICNFDFEEVYGDLGSEYIEGHHTIAVSEMKPDHKTLPEEIAMVCSNCHKMLHRKRPWLSIKELKTILKR